MIDRTISKKIPVGQSSRLSIDGSELVEIGIKYYNTSGDVVTPVSGTFDITGIEFVSSSVITGTGSPLDSTTQNTVTFNTDISNVLLTPNSITGADFYEVYISYNDVSTGGGSGGPLDPVAVKTAYESNPDTNAYDDNSKQTADLLNASATTGVSGLFGDTESIIWCTTGNITITMETVAITRAIQQFYVKDISGTIDGSSPITISTEGTETIDGQTSIQITVPYGVIKMRSDGTNLYTL